MTVGSCFNFVVRSIFSLEFDRFSVGNFSMEYTRLSLWHSGNIKLKKWMIIRGILIFICFSVLSSYERTLLCPCFLKLVFGRRDPDTESARVLGKGFYDWLCYDRSEFVEVISPFSLLGLKNCALSISHESLLFSASSFVVSRQMTVM